MTILMGIDPGSRITGYGIIQIQQNQYHYIASGCIRTEAEHISGRLNQIYQGLKDVISEHLPHEVAIEQVFVHQNIQAALKLGQARGAAIVAAAAMGISVAEYSAREIKQAVVGYGAATKDQIQHMVKRLLNLQGTIQADAADALAVAMCHSHGRRLKKLLINTGVAE